MNACKTASLNFELPPPVICAIELSDPQWEKEWMSELLRQLIRRGGVYFSFHGMRCEEAHDIADIVRDDLLMSTDEKTVMTTWHCDESLVDFLDFVATSAMPSEGYYCMGPLSYLVIGVGDARQKESHDLLAAVREIFV